MYESQYFKTPHKQTWLQQNEQTGASLINTFRRVADATISQEKGHQLLESEIMQCTAAQNSMAWFGTVIYIEMVQSSMQRFRFSKFATYQPFQSQNIDRRYMLELTDTCSDFWPSGRWHPNFVSNPTIRDLRKSQLGESNFCGAKSKVISVNYNVILLKSTYRNWLGGVRGNIWKFQDDGDLQIPRKVLNWCFNNSNWSPTETCRKLKK